MDNLTNDSIIETAYGVLYAAGVIIAGGVYLTLGVTNGAWLTALPGSIAGGIGFGLLMHGWILYRIARLREQNKG